MHTQVHHPVAATYHGAQEGWTSTKIAHEDFARMATYTRVPAPGRRFATPSWAVNDAELSELLVFSIMLRAGFRNQIAYENETVAERLTRAENKLQEKRPDILADLQRLCARYVEEKRQPKPDADKVHSLEILIANRDTMLHMIDAGCARIILGVVYHYYRRGLNSLQVAEEIGFRHCHVRQILYRLHEDWLNLKGIEPERLTQRYRPFEGHDYTVNDEHVFILRSRGLRNLAIACRLGIPVFEVRKALTRIKKNHLLALEVSDTVREQTGEVIPVPDLPRRFDSLVSAPPTENIRYKVYVQFCERLGHSPMSERVWQIQDKSNRY